jgi:acyl-CoA thioester hydrolase
MMNRPDALSLNGWMEAHTHIYPLKVQYEDTDAGGVVYHANYLNYAERARSAGFTLMDINQQERLADGKAFVVAGLDIKYHKPARLGDVIKVVTTTVHMTGVRIMLKQDIMTDSDMMLATLNVTVVYASLEGQPIRLDAYTKNTILATMPPQNHGMTH